MDDALLERWKSGDAMARVAVRNTIRGIADRVLGHPGLHRAIGLSSGSGLLEEDARREVTAGIAAEVMKRGAPDASQLTALALIVAGRRAVEELQSRRPVSEENHTPPQALVTYALAGQGMAPRVRQAVERHTEGCAACRDDVRILGNILRNQEAVGDHVDKDRVSAEFDREAREAAPDLGPEMAARLKGAEEAATAEVAREAMERIARASSSSSGSGSSGKGPRRPRPRVHRDQREEPTTGALGVILPVLAVSAVMGGIWWFTQGRDASVNATRGEVATIADREAPKIRNLNGLPESAIQAAKALADGDCVSAAGRLRGARREAPEEIRLPYLEGAAWVCAGKGSQALDAFEQVVTLGGDLPRSFHWYRAQAYLLEGQALEAIEDLAKVQMQDPRHRDEAMAQHRRLQALR